MKKQIWIIIALAALFRLINIHMPLLEGSATRQIYSAMVAKHFYEEDMNILYPSIPIKGNEPFYQALEIQFIPYLAAISYKITNGIHTEAFRIIAILFTILTLYVLYLFIRDISNHDNALVAVFFFAFSPISIYLGRSANFEMPIIFFNIAALWFFYTWTRTVKFKFCIFGNISFIFAVLLKLPNLYLLLPVYYILWQKWGIKSFKKNWLIILSFIPIVLANYWMHNLRVIAPDKNWLHFNLSYNLHSMAECFTSVEFYKKIYNDSLNYVLTPFGFVFLMIGLLLKLERKEQRIFYYWLAGVILFFTLVAEGFGTHGYYHVHYMPAASFFMAIGFNALRKSLSPALKNPRAAVYTLGFLFLLVSLRYSIPFFTIPENKKFVLKASGILKEKVAPNELIVACVDSPSSLLYYSDRKGWGIEFSYRGDEAIPMLEDLRKRGAAYFVCSYKTELYQNKKFLDYLTSKYRVVMDEEYCFLVNLK